MLFIGSAKESEAVMLRCWFSGEPIDPNRKDWDRHHLLCRRYYKDYPGEDPDEGNVVPALVEHHRRWHQEFDDPTLPLTAFFHYMLSLDFGRNIFAQPDAMAAD